MQKAASKMYWQRREKLLNKMTKEQHIKEFMSYGLSKEKSIKALELSINLSTVSNHSIYGAAQCIIKALIVNRLPIEIDELTKPK